MNETKMEVMHLNQEQLATRWNISEASLGRHSYADNGLLKRLKLALQPLEGQRTAFGD